MIIQTASLAHLTELSLLFDQYRIFYGKTSNTTAAQSFLTDRITRQESIIFIAYANDEQAVGFTQLYPIFSSTRMARLWLLNDLYVAPDYRGRGYSLALIDAAKAHAISTNAVGLTLETTKTNEIGNQLYPRTGFFLDSEHHFYSWDNPNFGYL
jgi:GNAT superfamily N-acetyltransferase